jgi:hypothetical protein
MRDLNSTHILVGQDPNEPQLALDPLLQIDRIQLHLPLRHHALRLCRALPILHLDPPLLSLLIALLALFNKRHSRDQSFAQRAERDVLCAERVLSEVLRSSAEEWWRLEGRGVGGGRGDGEVRVLFLPSLGVVLAERGDEVGGDILGLSISYRVSGRLLRAQESRAEKLTFGAKKAKSSSPNGRK